MDHLEQLRRWGAAHGAAREAERQAALAGGERRDLLARARELRERADRLHADAYVRLGRKGGSDARASAH